VPHVQTRTLRLPFSGTTPRTRTASLSGARVAITRAGSQCARMLIRYLEMGAQTDGQQALALGLPEGRISARRASLIERGLVAELDKVHGPYGADCTRFELTVKGLHVAAALKTWER
jgi:hypothetical protein